MPRNQNQNQTVNPPANQDSTMTTTTAAADQNAPTLSADALLFGLIGKDARASDKDAARKALLSFLATATGETADVVGQRIPRDVGAFFLTLATTAGGEGGSWEAGASDAEKRGTAVLNMGKRGKDGQPTGPAIAAAAKYRAIGSPAEGAARYLAARLAHGRVASAGDSMASEAKLKKVTSYGASPERDR